jgi:general secretion pathway protein K
MLAALLTEFAFSTLVDLRLTETFRDSTRAYYLAKGGVTVGRVILRRDTNTYDALDEDWARGLANFPVGDGVVSIFIDDQGGKIDINALEYPEIGTKAEWRRRAFELFSLLNLPEPPENLLAALIDRLDKDEDVTKLIELYDPIEILTVQGVESPNAGENGRLTSLDELATISVFTPDIIRRLKPFITVNGGGTLNINTASKEVLMAFSTDTVEINQTTAEAIIALREDEPFIDVKERIEPLLSGKLLSNTIFGVTSTTFRIETEGGVGDGVRRIEAFLKRDRTQGTTELLYIKVN